MAGTKILCGLAQPVCINEQGGRQNKLTNLTLIGPNADYALGLVYGFYLPSDPFDWLAPELASTGTTPGGLQQHSPGVGFCVDCYAGTAPAAPLPAVVYPAPTNTISGNPSFSTTQYGKGYSSDTLIRGASIQGFACQICSGANTSSQGDFLKMQEVDLRYGPIGVGVYNAQNRNVGARNFTTSGLHTIFDTYSIGMQQGTWGGPIDNVSASQVYQIFNMQGDSRALTLKNFYVEGMVRIGNILGGAAYGAGLPPEKWSSLKYGFLSL